MFVGFVQIDGTIRIPVVTKDSNNEPVDADAVPSYRVYGPAGLMTNGTGVMALKDSKAITGATNASPIVVTSNGHGLVTGLKVTISGVLGNTAANGTFTITKIGSNTFSLDGSTGSGAYTSGGTWHISGLYDVALTPTAGNGFDQGENYIVFVNYAVSSDIHTETFTFGVV